MALLRYAAKFDLSLDCARVDGGGAQSKERKGSNFAAQRSGAIVLQARRAKCIESINLAIVIWQPWWQRAGAAGRTRLRTRDAHIELERVAPAEFVRNNATPCALKFFL